MDSEDRYRFKKQLKALKEMRGQGTELISIYIPPYYNPIEVTSKLREEAGQAMNIKSKQTRKNVTGAIERLLHALKGFRAVPEHGIAFFCGNINDKIELYSLTPPEPLTLQTYRCDSTFFTEPLEDLLEAKETYGLLVVDRREATIALLKGKSIKIVKHMHSQVPGKHRAGGQSSSRFESLIEIAAHAWFKKVGTLANMTFSKQGVTVVLLGGPGPTKHSFLKGNFLSNEVKKKVEATIDTGYTDEAGIKDLMHNAEEITEKLEITKEKKILSVF